MTTSTTHDFSIGAVRCRWQAMPAAARAQDIARAWLRAVADDAVAEGLHRDARNRPRLARGDAGWSHSHGRLFLAYGDQGCVGVDVESRTRHTNSLRVARRYFAEDETDALAALASEARQLAFLRLWCAKEAVLKAHGGGIAFGLHKVVFDAHAEGLRMVRCDPGLGSVADWNLHLLAPEPDYIAVLASRA